MTAQLQMLRYVKVGKVSLREVEPEFFTLSIGDYTLYRVTTDQLRLIQEVLEALI